MVCGSIPETGIELDGGEMFRSFVDPSDSTNKRNMRRPCALSPETIYRSGTRTGRATLGLRAWLAAWRLAVRERIRSIA
jgi:hypothetical protein